MFSPRSTSSQHRRRASSLFAVAAVACAAVAVATASTPAVAAPGGRVVLQSPVRLLDTRGGPGIGPGVREAVLGSGLLTVTIVDAGGPGTATVYPCGSTPGGVPATVFGPEAVEYFMVVADGSCLSLSTPAHVIVDLIGTVAASPFGGGQQYVPLASPVRAFDGFGSARAGVGAATQIDIGAVPVEARAVVLLIEVNDPVTAGFAKAYPCATPRPVNSDMSWVNDRAVGIAYVDVTQGPICVWQHGEAGSRVTVLGHLSSDGPDPNRLPPTLNAPLTQVRPPGLRAITPVRVADSRNGSGTPGARPLEAGETLELEITQASASTTAVALNVTVTEPAAAGYLTVFPCDRSRPKASNLNYVAGETVPNLVNVKLSVTRSVCLYTQQKTHLIVDLAGTFEAGGGAGAQPMAPVRILDTRTPIGVPEAGRRAAGSVLVLQVAGRGGVPVSGVAAVTMNVTVTDPEAEGFVTVYPCDRPRPTASNLNFAAGQTVPNLVSVRLSTAGTVCLFAQRATHLLADLAAWYAVDENDGYREVAPDRLLDTREGIGAPLRKVAAGGTLVLQVAGRSGVPSSGVSAVTMNVTATEAEGDGYVTVYPCDAPRPEASNLNHASAETVPNLVTVQVAGDGTVCLFAQRSVHLIADVAGYFTEATDLRNTPTLV